MLRIAVAVKNFHAPNHFRRHQSGLSDISIVPGLFAHETGMSNKTDNLRGACTQVRRRGRLVRRDELDSGCRIQSMISICDCLLHVLRE